MVLLTGAAYVLFGILSIGAASAVVDAKFPKKGYSRRRVARRWTIIAWLTSLATLVLGMRAVYLGFTGHDGMDALGIIYGIIWLIMLAAIGNYVHDCAELAYNERMGAPTC